MDVMRREDLQRGRTELGAAVPYSTVPSAARDFQLGICTVVLAWENQASALHIQSLHWGRHRGDRKAVVGESSVCQEGKTDTFLK